MHRAHNYLQPLATARATDAAGSAVMRSCGPGCVTGIVTQAEPALRHAPNHSPARADLLAAPRVLPILTLQAWRYVFSVVRFAPGVLQLSLALACGHPGTQPHTTVVCVLGVLGLALLVPSRACLPPKHPPHVWISGMLSVRAFGVALIAGGRERLAGRAGMDCSLGLQGRVTNSTRALRTEVCFVVRMLLRRYAAAAASRGTAFCKRDGLHFWLSRKVEVWRDLRAVVYTPLMGT